MTNDVEAYLQYSEATGHRFPVEGILATFRQLNRQHLFGRLAEIAAALANRQDQSAEGESFTTWALDALSTSASPRQRSLAINLKRVMRPGRSLLHEKGIYLLQSLALVEGADEGRDPTDADLALLALAVNDYAEDWRSGTEDLSADLGLLAEFTHLARFNRHPDPVRSVLRGDLLLSRFAPRHAALRTRESWFNLQNGAFGRSYAEHVVEFLGPLAMQANSWMNKPGADRPFLESKSWATHMKHGAEAGAAFLQSMTISASQARIDLQKSEAIGGLYRFPLPLYRTPFVEFEPGRLVGASPWLINHQLTYGFWARCLAEAKRAQKGLSATAWFSAFGDVFESYCRWLAAEAQNSPTFPREQHRFIPSSQGSADEIEDVVLHGPEGTVLFSVKSRVMTEKDVRAATSRKDLVEWLESFFFNEAEDEYRGGALRLLDAKVGQIRTGRKEPKVPRGSRIYPVLITYDPIGESIFLSRWLQRRVEQEGLLQAALVEAPLVLDITSFETLLAIAAQGENIFGILRLLLQRQAGGATFLHIVRDHVPSHRKTQLPVIECEFQRVVAQITKQFGDA